MWKRKWKVEAEAGEDSGTPAEPVEREAEESSDDSSLWDDLLADDSGPVETEFGDSDTDLAPTTASDEAKPAPVEEVVEKQAPLAVDKPQPVEEKVVEQTAAQPPPVVSQEQPTQPEIEQRQQTPEEKEFLRKKALEGLTARYALSEEDATAFQVEPEKVLPKLAATLHASIYEDVVRRIVAEAPALIERTVQTQKRVNEAEEAFFKRWEDLRPHSEQVKRVAVMWRQMYPGATLEQAVEGVGLAARALGLGRAQEVAAPPPPPPPPPPPAGPSSRAAAMPHTRSRLSAEEQAFVDLAKTFEEEF